MKHQFAKYCFVSNKNNQPGRKAEDYDSAVEINWMNLAGFILSLTQMLHGGFRVSSSSKHLKRESMTDIPVWCVDHQRRKKKSRDARPRNRPDRLYHQAVSPEADGANQSGIAVFRQWRGGDRDAGVPTISHRVMANEADGVTVNCCTL